MTDSNEVKPAEAQGSQTGTRWFPITTAPKTGEHILAARFDGGTGFGFCGGKQQADCDVVHYWDNPGEEGFYPSNGPDVIFRATHWQPLEGLPKPAEAPAQPEKCPNCSHPAHVGVCPMPCLCGIKRQPFFGDETAQPITAEEAAKDFHETYERLAPQFGYETRKESAKPWAEIPENNRKLMIAVAGEVIQRAINAATAPLEAEVKRLREQVALQQGANKAQDERERNAGLKCGVDYNLSGCDWPDAAAEKILELRAYLTERDRLINLGDPLYPLYQLYAANVPPKGEPQLTYSGWLQRLAERLRVERNTPAMAAGKVEGER